MSIVRPFPARLVHPDHARHAVRALSESPGAAEAEPPGLAAEPAAYVAMAPALYVYRQCRDGAAHAGVVCDVAIRAFVDRQVRGHEAVHPGRVEGLVRHHAETAGPPALVTLLHRAGPAFTTMLDATCGTPPLLDFPGPDGLHQRVWRVADEPAAAEVAEELAAAELYIADGHHRVAAALEEWRLAGEPPDATLLCVVHPMDGLQLSAFHRRLTGPVDRSRLLELLAPEFELRPATEPPTPRHGWFGLYVDRGWFDVRHRGPRAGGRCGLDVTVLQEQLLDELVRPGSSYGVEIAAARTPVAELTARCDADGGALFTLAPPPLDVLTRLADGGEVMPPKTTYFEPKPCAGIFLRP